MRFGSSSTTNWLQEGQAVDEDETSPAVGKRYLANLEAFSVVFNGRLWEKGVYTHYCAGAGCCSCAELDNDAASCV